MKIHENIWSTNRPWCKVTRSNLSIVPSVKHIHGDTLWTTAYRLLCVFHRTSQNLLHVDPALRCSFSHLSHFFSLCLTFAQLFLTFLPENCSFLLFFSFFLMLYHVIHIYVLPSRVRFALFCSFLHFFACCWHVCSRVVTCMVSVVVYLCIALPPCPLGCHHGCVAVYGCVCSQPLESQTGLKRLYSKLKLLGCCFFFNFNPMRKNEKKWNEKTWENVRKSGNRWKKVR